MASAKKQVQQLARQLFRLSLADGTISPERVSGVLAYVELHRPARAAAVLKAYRHFVAAELARSQAAVEHAGPLADSVLQQIATAMTRHYRRPITPVGRRNDALIAGLRVRVGDDIYESSVAAQLATLAASV